ncbi:hypothetical protein E2C01_093282 [Portunus trituberculatus]|uniref:Uncharacterized protein n=1 Tax=Portunus trituberculatus TaxID=210409 RepID=A0A5B7JUD5_PORTR|nr:hypothetical protein [Portunus trituberculatus]
MCEWTSGWSVKPPSHVSHTRCFEKLCLKAEVASLMSFQMSSRRRSLEAEGCLGRQIRCEVAVG